MPDGACHEDDGFSGDASWRAVYQLILKIVVAIRIRANGPHGGLHLGS
jgi:hypothetical protein